MKIEVLFFRGCPNHPPAVDRVKTVLRQEGLSGELSEIEISDAAMAKALKFPGSPTIRVNGLDIEAGFQDGGEWGLACRRYADGAPPEGMIRAALKQAQERERGKTVERG